MEGDRIFCTVSKTVSKINLGYFPPSTFLVYTFRSFNQLNYSNMYEVLRFFVNARRHSMNK